MLQWEHFNEPSVVTVFLALLLVADKGQTEIGLGGLAAITGLSKNTIRGALAKLVNSGEIERQTAKGQRTITTITNWNEYQAGQKSIHHDKKSVSKNDTPVYQKLTKSVSKNDTPVYQKLTKSVSKNDTHNKNKNNKENIVVADAHTRTHEEFIADALNDLRVEQGCMAMRITPEQYRQLVTEVTNDWIYRQLPDDEWTLTHLLAQMRIKHNINNRNNGNNQVNSSADSIRAKLDQDAAKAMATLASRIGQPTEVPF
jgi:DNA-binding transcriptional regulator GbsR (MarR family)